jgi:ammonium transporter, Amt family
MLVPSPKCLDTGDNAWNSSPPRSSGCKYSAPGRAPWRHRQKEMGDQHRLHGEYAFAAVLLVWILFAYNMACGPQLWSFLGMPMPAIGSLFETGQATVPVAASGMPPLAFPVATMTFFQLVFAAITVIIMAGSLIGRMNFKAWVLFVPLWMTFVHTVGAFSLWGAGGSPAWSISLAAM